MFNGKKVVVTMTSWSKRIGNCVQVIQSILENTVRPDIVFLNLSLKEFPNRLNDLPKDLVDLSLKNPIVKIGFDVSIGECFDDYIDIDIGQNEFVNETYVEKHIEQHKKSVDDAKNYKPKVVVAMTSWIKRIGNCYYVINQLLSNTMKPDIVFLSLSTQEFPNLYDDLPSDLVKLCMSNQRVKINWVTGENTKSMKKVYPILQYLNDDDIIILCDDDLDIPNNFIQVRVQEFVEHHCMFPISGGTNPKYHLNIPLYHTKYNSLAATSIFSKKMLKGYDKIWTSKVIETYKDDTIHTLLCLSNGYYPIPSKYLSTFSGVTKQKIPFYRDNDGMKDNHIWKSDKETIEVFVEQFNKVNPYKFEDSLINLVIFDSFDVAGDNGECLYRKVRDIYPNINLTFILSNTSPDWERLEKDGFNLYPFEGPDISFLMKNATYILWSKDTSQFKYLYENRNKSVFISHGRTSRLYDCSKYYSGRISKCVKYVSCTSDEEARVVTDYSRNNVVPIVSGFPRHDFVLTKSKFGDTLKNDNSNKIRQVLISFHYRSGTIDQTEEHFKSSDYLKSINAMLNDSKLKKLSQNGVKIVFITHARFKKYSRYFKIPSYIEFANEKQFQKVFIESDALITDFSSTSFEFAYMNKPTFVYIPDYEFVINHQSQYHIENICQYPHLIMCSSINDIVDEISRFNLNPQTYDFYSGLFKFHDTNNSKRLIDSLMEIHHGC